MRRQIVAGNWKMNGSQHTVAALLDEIKTNSGGLSPIEVAVFPSYPYLDQVAKSLQNTPISWGAQNVCDEASGAFTGEVSAEMLLDFQCKYVIVGHSERRMLYNESDLMIARKFALAKKSGFVPIYCVGETLLERQKAEAQAVVARQLKAILDLENGIELFQGAVIAYEPVWAIGTGMTATPTQAQEMHQWIREYMAGFSKSIAGQLPVLYGGSVKAVNAAELFAMQDIDGGLIGGASLNAQEFLAICHAAKEQLGK